MKTKLLILLMVLVTTSAINAQTSVSISYAGDTIWNNSYCHVPDTAWFNTNGYANGYAPNDSVTVYVNFGDGTDTTFKSEINQNSYWSYYYHAYTAKGTYNARYIVTGSDGKADT